MLSRAASMTDSATPGSSAVTDRMTAIYQAEGQRLAGLGRLLTGSIEEGEDAAHEVFVRALTVSQDNPEYLQDPVWPWLRTALVRLVIQRRRSMIRERRRLARFFRPTDERPWPAETADVAAALRALSPRMRACAVLHHCEDLTVAQTADVVGCSPATALVHLREARSRLRGLLGDEPAVSANPRSSTHG